MTSQVTHAQYLSPFAWRYGSEAMRAIWSEMNKRRLWRRIWVALAAAQARAGLVSQEELEDLRRHQDDVDIDRSHTVEREIRHDLMAEIRVYAEQCPVGGGKIHLGATSMDIEDNADALRLRDSLGLLRRTLVDCLQALGRTIKLHSHLPCMGFTHIQPAEPTTVGYRLSQYAQDLLQDLQQLDRVLGGIRGKGFKGAAGTSASYARLLAGTGVSPAEMEQWVMEELGLPPFPVTTQVYPRKQDLDVLNVLANICASAHKFAFDLRILQSPAFGEWSEPFGRKQVGSSAMPFKRNPILAEKICSLARYVSTLPTVLWHDAANSLLERTLDDSANRRATLPDAFLATEEVLLCLLRLLEGLTIHEPAISRNMNTYGPFAAIEALLMELAKHGADRQEMHELLREHAMVAWAEIQAGQPNPLVDNLSQDSRLSQYIDGASIRDIMDATGHLGDASERALQFAQTIDSYLARTGDT